MWAAGIITCMQPTPQLATAVAIRYAGTHRRLIPALAGRPVYVGSLDNRVYALYADTGTGR